MLEKQLCKMAEMYFIIAAEPETARTDKGSTIEPKWTALFLTPLMDFDSDKSGLAS